jgi:D-amino-acid dehydrogenase
MAERVADDSGRMGFGMEQADVVVVGAGVIGLCCAYELRKRGLDVLVLDRGRPGSGASHANGGWICPSYSDPLPAPGLISSSLRGLLWPENPLYVRPRPSADFARWLWAFGRSCNERSYQDGLRSLLRLNERTLPLYDEMRADGVAFEMHEQGLLFLFISEAGLQEASANVARLMKLGRLPADVLSRESLRAEGLAVSDRVVAGLLAWPDRHVRPETLIEGLVGRLGELRVPVRAGLRVSGFERQGRGVGAVITTQGRIVASQVVLAAGIWTVQLAAMLGIDLPLQAGKGYSVTMAGTGPNTRRPLNLYEAHMGISPYDGAWRILGTMELSGMNTYLNPRRLAALKEAPRPYFRTWEVTHIQEEWTGMRPLTPDGLPIIGAVPAAENLIMATGHAMLGVTLGPSTGRAVADLIAGQPDSGLLDPFRPDRF